MQLWTRVNTAAANPAHGLGGGSLTMGGCQRDISIYERYSSATVDAVHCPCSDGVAMMVSDGGDGRFRWSSGPDHIKPTLGPCCGENGVVSRGRAARRSASARDAEIRATLLHLVQHCHT